MGYSLQARKPRLKRRSSRPPFVRVAYGCTSLGSIGRRICNVGIAMAVVLYCSPYFCHIFAMSPSSDALHAKETTIVAKRTARGLRFPDLRHTVVTRLLEAGEPDHVGESITGHLSQGCWSTIPHPPERKAALDRLDGSIRALRSSVQSKSTCDYGRTPEEMTSHLTAARTQQRRDANSEFLAPSPGSTKL